MRVIIKTSLKECITTLIVTTSFHATLRRWILYFCYYKIDNNHHRKKSPFKIQFLLTHSSSDWGLILTPRFISSFFSKKLKETTNKSSLYTATSDNYLKNRGFCEMSSVVLEKAHNCYNFGLTSNLTLR